MGLSVAEAIPPNPLRKALIFNPLLCCNSGVQSVTAAVFNTGLAQSWTVPAGVTSIIDAYMWGAGGASGAGGVTLGGGGGGGGAFSRTGTKAAVPGSVWTINVAATGSFGTTDITDGTGTQLGFAGVGADGALDAAGVGGTAGTGIENHAGGDGAASTALGGQGAGSGSSAGLGFAGNSAAGAVGGAAVGNTGVGGYGLGGAGSNGQLSSVSGLPGGSPGGGGSGGGRSSATAGAGAAGLAVILYPTPCCQQGLSLSPNRGLTYGNGVINLTDGTGYPIILTDNDFGSIIGEPWYAIAGIAGLVLNVLDVSYDQMEIDKEF